MGKVGVTLRLVYISSPLRGDMEKNMEKAKDYCAYAASCGVIPLAPHTIFTQYLNDTVPEQREQGLRMGHELLERCDELWVMGDTKTPFSSLIVALVVFGLPGIIRQMLNQNPLRDILIAFPINAVNVQEVLRLPINTQSIFYNHPYAPAASIGIVTLCILILSSAITHTAFRNHQPL